MFISVFYNFFLILFYNNFFILYFMVFYIMMVSVIFYTMKYIKQIFKYQKIQLFCFIVLINDEKIDNNAQSLSSTTMNEMKTLFDFRIQLYQNILFVIALYLKIV